MKIKLWFLQRFILSHLALVKKFHDSTMFRFNQFRIVIYSAVRESKVKLSFTRMSTKRS
jgi:hypothetical protein